MHELSLMEGMVQMIEEQARAGGHERVYCVVLEVGRLANVEVEALRFAFEVVTKRSVAEGASLEVEEPPGLGWCAACEQEVALETRFDFCPLCHQGPVTLTSGTQLRLKAIDVA